MARINIDDSFFADPRFGALVRILGDDDKAAGMCLRFWRLAQRYWINEKLVPIKIFHAQKLEALVQVDLAEVREDGVYCRGSDQAFDWLNGRRNAAKKGGKKSAAARREKFGSAVPINASNSPAEAKPNRCFGEKSEANRSKTEAPPNPLALAPDITLVTALDIDKQISSYKRGDGNAPSAAQIINREKMIRARAVQLADRVMSAFDLAPMNDEAAKVIIKEPAWTALMGKFNSWERCCNLYSKAFHEKQQSAFISQLKESFEAAIIFYNSEPA